MRIVFLTAPRSPAYLHQTLASMLLADSRASQIQVVLLLDADDDGFTAGYAHHGRVQIVRQPPAVRALGVMQRITTGFRRALLETPQEEELLIAEDDLIFCDGWTERLRDAEREARSRSGDRYLLSGYAAYSFAQRPISPYPVAGFYGNQLLYVPALIRKSLADYMMEHVNEENGDMLVKRWAMSTGTPVWATVPALVQHVGNVSGAGSPAHKTPMWSPTRIPFRQIGAV